MQTISNDLNTKLSDGSSQTVKTKVIATWADSKYLPNLKVFSSGDWYHDVITAAAPFAWYKLNDVANTLNDYSGNGYDGDFFGGWTAGQTGIPALATNGTVYAGDASTRFNGSTGYARVLDSDVGGALQLTDNFTIECWIKFASLPGGTDSVVVAKATSTPTTQYKIFANSSSSNQIAVSVHDFGGTTRTVQSTIAGSTSAFQHIVVTRSGVNLILTINGTNVFSVSNVATGNLTSNVGDFTIGRLGAASSGYTDGYVDEVAIYNRVLSDDEIQTHYEMGIRTTDLQASRRFNSAQAFNGLNRASMKWGIVDVTDSNGATICCDQGYRVMDDPAVSILEGIYEYGWWSRRKTQSDGTFASSGKEILYATFGQRLATSIEVYTSEHYVPISTYKVYYKDTNDAWIQVGGTQTMPVNSFVQSHDLGGALVIKGVKIEVLTTQKGLEPARIQELNPVYETDISTDVVSCDVEKQRDHFDTTVPVGITSANSCNLVLDNTSQLYNAHSSNPLSAYLRKDVKLTISYLWQLPDSSFEEIKQGEFWVDQWNNEAGNLTITPSTRDYSKFLQEDNQDVGAVYVDKTAGQAIADLAARGGVPKERIKFVDTWHHTIVNDRPYAWWKFNEQIGTVLHDELNISNGTIVGSPVLGSAGAITGESSGYAMRFDGTDDYNSIPDNNNLDISSTWTVEFWIKLYSTFTGDKGIVSKDGLGNDTTGAYNIYITDTGQIKYETNNVDNLTTTGAGISNGSGWHHVVLTFDNTASPKMNIYVNGVVKASGNVTAPTNNAQTLLVGRYGTGGFLKAYLDDLVFYKKALSPTQITSHYNAGRYISQAVFPYLFLKGQTIWDAMVEFAMADLGMFYFDELNNFNFENADHFYNSTDGAHTHHSSVQYNLSDSTNIVTGTELIELQANFITVQVNPKVTKNIGKQGIWRADDNASLAVTALGANIGRGSSTITVTSTDSPVWPVFGSFKINNEIITYTGKTLYSFTGCKRGQYGTAPSAHTAGVLIREHRIYKVEYSNSPVIDVDYPYISAKELEKKIDIDEFSPGPYRAVLRVSANEAHTHSGDIVYLEGTDPLTDLHYYTAIAGIPIVDQTPAGQENSQAAQDSDTIRRYRTKKITINNVFIQDANQAKKIADFLLAHYQNPVPIIELETLGIPHLQLGDRVRVTAFNQMSIINVDYWIMGISINYDGGIHQRMRLREVS